MDVFARGNNHVFHWWVNDDRWPAEKRYEELFGEIDDRDDSAPAAIATGFGMLEVFAVGARGDLLRWHYGGAVSGWIGPTSLGGRLRRGQQPAAVAKLGLRG